MVADAATLGRLRPAVAWVLLASLAIGMAAVAAINDRAAPYRAGLLALSPEVLRVRAAQILDRAGRSGDTRDWAAGFEFDPDVAAFLRRDGSAGQWRRAERGRPGLIRFWYRERDWWVIPWSMTHLPSSVDPPPTEAGAIVQLDRDGTLQRLTTTAAPGTDVPPFLPSIWFPLTLDPNAFYFTSSMIVTALLLGLGWCALYTTLGGKPLGGWTERPSV